MQTAAKNKNGDASGGKIWNAAFISIFIANAMMNLGQQMVNTLIAKYADYLGAAATAVGLLAGLFSATALFFKLFSGPAMDSFSRKKLLMGSMALMAFCYIGFGISSSMPMLMFFRLLEGTARAFTATGCLAIASDTLPAEKFGSGIGIFSLAQGACQAIGPTIGLTIYRYIGYNNTFFLAACCVVLGVAATGLARIPEKEHKTFKITLSGVAAIEAIIPAVLLFLFVGTYFTVSSFIAIYGTNMGVVNIGLYFTVYACVMLVSRPIVGKLSDKFGVVKVMIPAAVCFALSLFIISLATNLAMFLIAAAIAAFGYGTALPTLQALAMKCVPSARRGAASNMAYIGQDLGNLAGPVAAGFVVEALGYRTMWKFMMLPMAVVVVLLIVFSGRIRTIESDFQARGNN